MRGFDELVERLLDQIALAGSQGLSAEQFENAVREYYEEKNANATGPERAADADLLFSDTPPPKETIVDDVLLGSVLDWAGKHPDITIIDEPKADNTQNEEQPQDVGISTFQSRTAGKRILTTEDRIWHAIAGHGVDHRRLPPLEFALLSIIAAHGPGGILQPYARDLSGQDKRSVPGRTDKLAAKGYIVKYAVIGSGQKTSALQLKKYAEGSNTATTSAPVAQPGSALGSRPVVFYNDWFDKTINLLKSNNNVVTMKDLRLHLKIEVKQTWARRVLVRCIRRLAAAGCMRRFTAKVLDSDGKALVVAGTGKERRARSVQLLREPTAYDAKLWKESDPHKKADNDSSDEVREDDSGSAADDDDAAAASGEEGELVEVDGELDNLDNLDTIQESVSPQWTADVPLPNLVYNAVASAGQNGLSSAKLNARVSGSLWRRPLEEVMLRLTDLPLQSQPPHLKHLTIVRDSMISNKVLTYNYRTLENFARAIEDGREVGDSARAALFADEQKSGSVQTDVDAWGFPKVSLKELAGRDGRATLAQGRKALVVESAQKIDNLADAMGEASNGAEPIPEKEPAVKESGTSKDTTSAGLKSMGKGRGKRRASNTVLGTASEQNLDRDASSRKRRRKSSAAVNLTKPTEISQGQTTPKPAGSLPGPGSRITAINSGGIAQQESGAMHADQQPDSRPRPAQDKTKFTFKQPWTPARPSIGRQSQTKKKEDEFMAKPSTPQSFKKRTIPAEEHQEFAAAAQRTAERQVMAEVKAGRKRSRAAAGLPDSDDSAENVNIDELPQERIAQVKANIIARQNPGIYINPPGARNLKLDTVKSGRGRPRKVLIAAIKTDRLKTLEWYKPESTAALSEAATLETTPKRSPTIPPEVSQSPPHKRQRTLASADVETVITNANGNISANEVHVPETTAAKDGDMERTFSATQTSGLSIPVTPAPDSELQTPIYAQSTETPADLQAQTKSPASEVVAIEPYGTTTLGFDPPQQLERPSQCEPSIAMTSGHDSVQAASMAGEHTMDSTEDSHPQMTFAPEDLPLSLQPGQDEKAAQTQGNEAQPSLAAAGSLTNDNASGTNATQNRTNATVNTMSIGATAKSPSVEAAKDAVTGMPVSLLTPAGSIQAASRQRPLATTGRKKSIKGFWLTREYVDEHPNETFHHRGKGRWVRGFPTEDVLASRSLAVRGPGATAWLAEFDERRRKAIAVSEDARLAQIAAAGSREGSLNAQADEAQQDDLSVEDSNSAHVASDQPATDVDPEEAHETDSAAEIEPLDMPALEDVTEPPPPPYTTDDLAEEADVTTTSNLVDTADQSMRPVTAVTTVPAPATSDAAGPQVGTPFLKQPAGALIVDVAAPDPTTPAKGGTVSDEAVNGTMGSHKQQATPITENVPRHRAFRPQDLVSTEYVDQHPNETFHHRGQGRWARGLPPPNKDPKSRVAIRGPGAVKSNPESKTAVATREPDATESTPAPVAAPRHHVYRPQDLVSREFVDQHPNETFHHRGQGRWARGLPPLNTDPNSKVAIRGPGAKEWKEQAAQRRTLKKSEGDVDLDKSQPRRSLIVKLPVTPGRHRSSRYASRYERSASQQEDASQFSELKDSPAQATKLPFLNIVRPYAQTAAANTASTPESKVLPKAPITIIRPYAQTTVVTAAATPTTKVLPQATETVESLVDPPQIAPTTPQETEIGVQPQVGDISMGEPSPYSHAPEGLPDNALADGQTPEESRRLEDTPAESMQIDFPSAAPQSEAVRSHEDEITQRQKIILDALRASGGAFPGNGELRYVVVTATKNVDITKEAVEEDVKKLLGKRIKKLAFTFKDKKGTSIRRFILTETGMDPTSTIVRTLQKSIIGAHPFMHLPLEVEIEDHLRAEQQSKNRKAAAAESSTGGAFPKNDIDTVRQISQSVLRNQHPSIEDSAARAAATNADRTWRPRPRGAELVPSLAAGRKRGHSNTDADFVFSGRTPVRTAAPRPKRVKLDSQVRPSSLQRRIPRNRDVDGTLELEDSGRHERIAAALMIHPEQRLHLLTGTFSTQGMVNVNELPDQRSRRERARLANDINRNVLRDVDEFLAQADKEIESETDDSDEAGESQTSGDGQEQSLIVTLKVPRLASIVNSSEPATGASGPALSAAPKRRYRSRRKSTAVEEELRDSDEEFVPEPAVPDASRRRSAKDSVGPVRSGRRNGTKRANAFQDTDRVVIAMALVSAVCGGVTFNNNWLLIAHALSFRYDAAFLRDRWPSMRPTRQVDVDDLREAIHGPFLEAYENNELPRVDFQNLSQTDWPALFDWVEDTLVHLKPQDGSKTYQLAESRKDVEHDAAVTEQGSVFELSRNDFFTSNTDLQRKHLATRYTNSVALYSHKQKQDDLVILKSWIRAVATTKQDKFQADVAAKKLRNSFTDSQVEQGISELLSAQVLSQERKGRHLPGRNYHIHNAVISQFRRWPAKPEEHQYLRQIAHAYQVINAHFKHYDQLQLNPAASDPEYLVLTNLVAQGWLKVTTILPERKDSITAPAPKLSAWGYCSGSYETKKVQLSQLKFPIVYVKTAAYNEVGSLDMSVPIPLQQECGQEEGPARTPFWVDIHGNFIDDIWDMLVRSVLHLLVFRSGLTAEQMANAHDHKLWSWELDMAMQWMEKVGLAVRCGAGEEENGIWNGGWTAGEQWYCAFLPEIAKWSGPAGVENGV